MLLELKAFQQRLELEPELELSRQSSGRKAKRTAKAQAEPLKASTLPDVVHHGNRLASIGSRSSGERPITNIYRHRRAGILALLTLTMVIAGILYFVTRGEAIDSVAILPFENESADPNSEYLSDGISDSIINSLSQLPNLRVTSLNSVLRYKGQQPDPQAIGRELNVRAVLLSRLTQRGDDLLVSTELVDVRDNRRIWADRYQRKLPEMFALQEEISREISKTLRLRLSNEDRRQLSKRYTENVEAYLLYQQGRNYVARHTSAAVRRGIEYFERAIKLDPAYAPAYVGLAQAYQIPIFSELPPKESHEKVRSLLLRALELDDTLAEAHAQLGSLKLEYDDLSGAEKELKRALELNPNSENVLWSYSGYLAAIGEHDAAIAEAKRALELDPLSPIRTSGVGFRFLNAGQFDQAIAQFGKALQMDPNYRPAHVQLGRAYLAKRMYKEAIEALEKATFLDDTPARGIAVLAYAYAVSGRTREAQKMLDELMELAKHEYVAPIRLAIIYAGLGHKDQAFAWLEKEYLSGSRRPDQFMDSMDSIAVDLMSDSLRSDPRFAEFSRRHGLAGLK